MKDHDDLGDCQMEWDNGRGLKLLDIDRFHVIETEDELDRSFEWLGRKQEDSYDKCPRCGKHFDVRRGAVSRRITKLNIMICDLCGQQEAIEDFLLYGHKVGTEVKVFVPEGKNKTGYDTLDEFSEDKLQKGQRIDVRIKPVSGWYIVKEWQGRAD